MLRRVIPPILLLLLTALSGHPASAQEGGGTYCTIAGSVTPTPGVKYTPQEGTYELSGTMDCSSSDPSHADVTGTGTGTIGCLGGSSEAVLTVAWDNDETSIMQVQVGEFAYGTGGYGTVEEGEFGGAHVGLGWGREAAGAEMRCGTTGVSSYQFAGGVMIG